MSYNQQRFEYRTDFILTDETDEVTERLNLRAEDGWQLKSVIPSDGKFSLFIFERPVLLLISSSARNVNLP